MKHFVTVMLFLFALLCGQTAQAYECYDSPDFLIAECEFGFCGNAIRIKNNYYGGCFSPYLVPPDENEIQTLERKIKVHQQGVFELQLSRNSFVMNYGNVRKLDFKTADEAKEHWEGVVWYATLNHYSAYVFMMLVGIIYARLIAQQFYNTYILKRKNWVYFVNIRLFILIFAYVVFPFAAHFVFYIDFYLTYLLFVGLLVLEALGSICKIIYEILKDFKIIKG